MPSWLQLHAVGHGAPAEHKEVHGVALCNNTYNSSSSSTRPYLHYYEYMIIMYRVVGCRYCQLSVRISIFPTTLSCWENCWRDRNRVIPDDYAVVLHTVLLLLYVCMDGRKNALTPPQTPPCSVCYHAARYTFQGNEKDSLAVWWACQQQRRWCCTTTTTAAAVVCLVACGWTCPMTFILYLFVVFCLFIVHVVLRV